MAAVNCVGPLLTIHELGDKLTTVILDDELNVISRRKTRVIDPVRFSDRFYYIDPMKGHSIIVTEGWDVPGEVFLHGPTENLVLGDDCLYYIDGVKKHLLRRPFEKNKSETLYKEAVFSFVKHENYLYVLDKDGLTYMDLGSGKTKQCLKGEIIRTQVLGERLLIWLDSHMPKPYLFDGEKTESLELKPADMVMSEDGNIYFADMDDYLSLYRWQKETSMKTRLYGKPCRHLTAAGRRLIFESEGSYRQMDLKTYAVSLIEGI